MVPLTLGGIKILCSSNKEFSKQDPMISPPVTIWPTLMFYLGSNNQVLSKLRAGTSAPLGMKTEFDYFAIVSRGL